MESGYTEAELESTEGGTGGCGLGGGYGQTGGYATTPLASHTGNDGHATVQRLLLAPSPASVGDDWLAEPLPLHKTAIIIIPLRHHHHPAEASEPSPQENGVAVEAKHRNGKHAVLYNRF